MCYTPLAVSFFLTCGDLAACVQRGDIVLDQGWIYVDTI